MTSDKEVSVGRLKLAIVQTVLLIAAFCPAAEPNTIQPEQQKSTVLRGVALDWILVGKAQYKRGLYDKAEESFLAARAFQEYLTAEEHKQLEENLDNTRRATVEKQAVIEQIKIANDLLDQGQPVKARAHYEKVRNNPYLTEQQRKQIAGEIQKADVALDKQMKEITALYNRSVEFYRAGDLEKAREGFAEVARYGLLIAPEGRSAEDYLVQIDSILTERLKSPSPAVSVLSPVSPTIKPPIERQAQSVQEQTAEVTAIAEPAAESALDARTKILRTYTKAVVEDTVAQVQRHVIRRDFDKAIDAVRKATDIVGENRSFIGEKAFAQYSVLLKQLVDRIIEARKAS